MKRKVEARYYYRFLCSVLLTAVVSLMFYFVWVRFAAEYNNTAHLMGLGNLGMAVGLYLITYFTIGYGIHAFKIGVERKASTFASQIITLFITDVIEIFLSMAITGQFRYFFKLLWRYALLFLVQAVVVGIIIILMIDLFRIIFPPINVLEIFGDYVNDVDKKVDSIKYKYKIKGHIHYKTENLEELIPKFDAVLINDVPAAEKNRILKFCFKNDKRVYFVPKISDIIVKTSEELNLFDTPLFLCRNIGMTVTEAMIKRCFDVVTASIALVVLSPLFLIVAIAIKAEDGGPVFFRQERYTIHCRKFMIYKFRSMIVDAEKDGRPHPAGEDDDRITKVGKVIRATRIDELPQLINIIKGEMSVVGPRPERVEHVEKYTEEIPEFQFRSKVKGGLTGYAQVYGKYNTTALDKLKMDLVYIMNYSLLLDFQIIVETLKILLRKESTEGFTEERAAQMHDSAPDRKQAENAKK